MIDKQGVKLMADQFTMN